MTELRFEQHLIGEINMYRQDLPSLIAAGIALLFAAGAAPADDCDAIVLGAAVSLTGKYAAGGIHTRNGYDFAIEKIRQAGGITIDDKCYRFEAVYYDDESSGGRAAALAAQLIDRDSVQYMLGPYSSELTAAIAPVTEKHQIPMVEAGGASRSLFSKGYRYLFAVLSTSEQYLASAIALAAEKAQENDMSPSDVKVAVAAGRDLFSQDIRAGVLEDAGQYGMQIIIDEQLPPDLSDMSAILSKVKRLKPDVLVVSGHSRGASTAVRQIQAQNVRVPMIALTHCEAADAVGNFGAADDDILCAAQWAETLTYSDKIFGAAASYEQELKRAYPEYSGRKVPYQTAQASAAVYVLKDALERTGTLDREAVRDAVAATDLSTFYGPIRFSEAGSNIAKPMVLRQIQEGEYNVVAPSRFASHPLNWPRN